MSMIRREHTGDATWWEDTKHLSVMAAIAVAIIIASGTAARVLFTAFYFLSAVTVPDHTAGDDPLIQVRRTVRIDAPIRYAVTVRTADFVPVCTTGWSRTLNYKRAAVFDDLGAPAIDISRPLSWWLGGKDVLARCEREGFGVGSYILTTCHQWMPFELPAARRCVQSNTFVRRERK